MTLVVNNCYNFEMEKDVIEIIILFIAKKTFKFIELSLPCNKIKQLLTKYYEVDF